MFIIELETTVWHQLSLLTTKPVKFLKLHRAVRLRKKISLNEDFEVLLIFLVNHIYDLAKHIL